VIDTTTNAVIATINVVAFPYGVAVSPDGTKVYVTHFNATGFTNTVSVIDTGTNAVIGTITVGANPSA
jgi:YVTN family beta-propeller protein